MRLRSRATMAAIARLMRHPLRLPGAIGGVVMDPEVHVVEGPGGAGGWHGHAPKLVGEVVQGHRPAGDSEQQSFPSTSGSPNLGRRWEAVSAGDSVSTSSTYSPRAAMSLLGLPCPIRRPRLMKATRSQPAASSRWWVVRSKVVPSSLRRRPRRCQIARRWSAGSQAPAWEPGA